METILLFDLSFFKASRQNTKFVSASFLLLLKKIYFL